MHPLLLLVLDRPAALLRLGYAMSPEGSCVQGFVASQWASGRWLINGFRFDGLELVGTVMWELV